jgi:hypothetical protein
MKHCLGDFHKRSFRFAAVQFTALHHHSYIKAMGCHTEKTKSISENWSLTTGMGWCILWLLGINQRAQDYQKGGDRNDTFEDLEARSFNTGVVLYSDGMDTNGCRNHRRGAGWQRTSQRLCRHDYSCKLPTPPILLWCADPW